MHLLLADDHGLFRDSMRTWLQQLDADMRIDTAADCAGLLRRLEEEAHPDLVLTDLCMPDMEGVASLRRICAAAGWTPVLVISANRHPQTIAACLAVGAAGYVPKSADGATMLDAIRRVLAGGTYAPALEGGTDGPTLPAFTTRQMDLLHCLTRGLSNREIADELCLSVGTVKQYVSDILDKLEVDNRAQAGIAARRILGLDGAF